MTLTMIIVWSLVIVAGAVVLAELFWRFVMDPLVRRMFRGGKDAPTPLPGNLATRACSVEVDSGGAVMRAWRIDPVVNPPPRAVVVLVHGWAQESGRMAGFAESLTEKGIACLLVDLRGHGRSDPYPDYNAKKMLADLERYGEWIEEQEVLALLPKAILGFSFGGLGALLSLCRDDRWAAAVSVGAPSSPMRGTRLYLEKQGLPADLLCRIMIPTIRREFGFHPKELAAPRNLVEVNRPVMVIHGTRDPIVPIREGKRLAKSVPEPLGRHLWVEGAGHSDILQNSRAIRGATDFLAEHLLQH